jgi:hypothetical protein
VRTLVNSELERTLVNSELVRMNKNGKKELCMYVNALLQARYASVLTLLAHQNCYIYEGMKMRFFFSHTFFSHMFFSHMFVSNMCL